MNALLIPFVIMLDISPVMKEQLFWIVSLVDTQTNIFIRFNILLNQSFKSLTAYMTKEKVFVRLSFLKGKLIGEKNFIIKTTLGKRRLK